MTKVWGAICLAGLALSVAEPALAQGAPAATSLADFPVAAMQAGRTVASARTDAQGGFRFNLAPGQYDVCLAGPVASGADGGQQRLEPIELLVVIATLDAGAAGATQRIGANQAPSAGGRHRLSLAPAAPGPRNGGHAGGQGLTGARGRGCFPYRVEAPGGDNAAGSTRTGEPVAPVLDMPPLDRPARVSTGGGVQVATGDINGDGLAETGTNPGGRGGRRVDPRIPPPALSTPRTVAVVGTLSLER